MARAAASYVAEKDCSADHVGSAARGYRKPGARSRLRWQQGLSSQQVGAAQESADRSRDEQKAGLRAEVASLEEVLRNQAHPKNLVAIRKSGTPVVASPSLSGKTLFLADAHDEFEMLDYNADWVHVRISGLSRGWIWRTSLEMPEGIPDVPAWRAELDSHCRRHISGDSRRDSALSRRLGPAPGKKRKDHLRPENPGKREKGGAARAKLEFAKIIPRQELCTNCAKSPELAGMVLIFDSVGWRYDRGDAADHWQMEGWRLDRCCPVASVLFRSAGNFHRIERGQWPLGARCHLARTAIWCEHGIASFRDFGIFVDIEPETR